MAKWMPVVYSTFVEDQTHNDTYLLITLGGTQLEIGSDPTSDGKTVNLPSDLRLCRLTDAPGDMPDGPGHWAFEGRNIHGTISGRRVYEIISHNNELLCIGTDRMISPSELSGKWTRLHMPWEANNG